MKQVKKGLIGPICLHGITALAYPGGVHGFLRHDFSGLCKASGEVKKQKDVILSKRTEQVIENKGSDSKKLQKRTGISRQSEQIIENKGCFDLLLVCLSAKPRPKYNRGFGLNDAMLAVGNPSWIAGCLSHECLTYEPIS